VLLDTARRWTPALDVGCGQGHAGADVGLCVARGQAECRHLGLPPEVLSYFALIGFRGLRLQALSEKHNSFLMSLKKKGFKEERVTTIGLYDIDKSHDPGIQQEPLL